MRGAVDYFVGDVALDGGVCVRDGQEGGVDEVGGVVDEMFRYVTFVSLCCIKHEVWRDGSMYMTY